MTFYSMPDFWLGMMLLFIFAAEHAIHGARHKMELKEEQEIAALATSEGRKAKADEIQKANKGMTAEDTVAVARVLREHGCDIIDVSTAGNVPESKPEYGRMYQVPFAERIRYEAELPVMAVGASFSALEVVPLIVLGHEAWENWRLKARAPWMENLKWPLMCFVAVAFWNMLGAGVFGFMINPPISLYYIQGLNTTPVHAHAALFGVYGFLALGFTLLVLRYIRPQLVFSERLMKTGFWWLNAGLVLMMFTSLLPIGLFQFHASVSEGLWYARGETFMQQPFIQTLRWVRTFGDVVFIVGAVAIAWQVVILGLWRKGARA